MIRFEIQTAPRPKPRHRIGIIGGQPRAIPDKQGEADERTVIALAAPHAPPTPFEGAVCVSLTFYTQPAASWPSWRRDAALAGQVMPTGRPDVDNLVKLVLDALNRSGRWWRDDAQVVEVHARKCFSERPRTEVEVIGLPEIANAAAWKARLAQSRDMLASHAPLPPDTRELFTG